MAMSSVLTNDLRVHAFVGTSENDPTPIWTDTGIYRWCTIGVIYRNRPSKSRFAVVEDRDGDYLVYDMFSVQLNDDYASFTIPYEAVRVFPTLDAALMSAQLKV